MTNKDAEVIKALAELGLRQEPNLSSEEESWLKQAMDSEEDYFRNIERVFNHTNQEK